MGIFRKKKNKLKEDRFTSVREFNTVINVNYLIIKLGGVVNIKSAAHDEELLVITLKNVEEINFKYFKTHKIIRNFLVNRENNQITLAFDGEIAFKLAQKINLIIS